MENVYFFVVGFVNNSNFFLFSFIFLEKNIVCVQLFCIAQKMFSLNIAKWVYDIADCDYHDACENKRKEKEEPSKHSRFSRFVQVVSMCGKINKETVVNTPRSSYGVVFVISFILTRNR